jgi:hypothetical protein
MKKFVLLLCISLVLSACSASGGNPLPSGEPPGPSSGADAAGKEAVVYAPDHPLTPEETIEQFFAQQYNAYIDLQYIDISCLLDTTQTRNRNSLVWLETLIQRRKLIARHQFCYVETTRYPYTITYQENAEDDRMEFWRSRGLMDEDEIVRHFTITGEKGRAYPPFMAVNGLHTMRLKQIDGVWKITFHYYPGASRFRLSTPLVLPAEEKLLADLQAEFRAESPGASAGETALPSGAVPYNGVRAVQYARAYTEAHNPAFYEIGDWMGNCANFISQCIWHGFGTDAQPDIARRENMTSRWYGGQGGGSPAWESVEEFWTYAAAPRNPREQGLHGEVVETVGQLAPGGIVQTRSGHYSDEERYNHSLLLVDGATLMLAQNSPDCFVYYSDLVNADTRFLNPGYLIPN